MPNRPSVKLILLRVVLILMSIVFLLTAACGFLFTFGLFSGDGESRAFGQIGLVFFLVFGSAFAGTWYLLRKVWKPKEESSKSPSIL